jgi:hypothetical protein
VLRPLSIRECCRQKAIKLIDTRIVIQKLFHAFGRLVYLADLARKMIP